MEDEVEEEKRREKSEDEQRRVHFLLLIPEIEKKGTDIFKQDGVETSGTNTE